jgi:hypothetical protein
MAFAADGRDRGLGTNKLFINSIPLSLMLNLCKVPVGRSVSPRQKSEKALRSNALQAEVTPVMVALSSFRHESTSTVVNGDFNVITSCRRHPNDQRSTEL